VSKLSSVSASSSRYESSIGKRGGAGAPGLGISGIHLTLAYPRGVWGKHMWLSLSMRSKQETNYDGVKGCSVANLANLSSRLCR